MWPRDRLLPGPGRFDALLSIAAVHPLQEQAVGEFLTRAGVGWPVVRESIAEGRLVEAEYKEAKFYVRRFNKAT